MEKVLIEKIPQAREIPGVKRWVEDRGEFIQIAYREEMHHLALFEIKKGFYRGNHYHEKKEEVFYIVQGRIRAVFLDLDTREREDRILVRGNKLRFKPRCGHIFHGLEDTLIVEYSPQVFDPEDSYKINLL